MDDSMNSIETSNNSKQSEGPFKDLMNHFSLPKNVSVYDIILKRPLTVSLALLISLFGLSLSTIYSIFGFKVRECDKGNHSRIRIRPKSLVGGINNRVTTHEIKRQDKEMSSHGQQRISSAATTPIISPINYSINPSTNHSLSVLKHSSRRKIQLMPLIEAEESLEFEECPSLFLEPTISVGGEEDGMSEDDYSSEASTLEDGEMLAQVSVNGKFGNWMKMNTKKQWFRNGSTLISSSEAGEERSISNSNTTSAASSSTTSSFKKVCKDSPFCPSTIFFPDKKSKSPKAASCSSSTSKKYSEPPTTPITFYPTVSIPVDSIKLGSSSFPTSTRKFTLSNGIATIGISHNTHPYPSLGTAMNLLKSSTLGVERREEVSLDGSGKSGLKLHML